MVTDGFSVPLAKCMMANDYWTEVGVRQVVRLRLPAGSALGMKLTVQPKLEPWGTHQNGESGAPRADMGRRIILTPRADRARTQEKRRRVEDRQVPAHCAKSRYVDHEIAP